MMTTRPPRPRKPDWATEAIVPAGETVRAAGRSLADLPKDVTPGAKQVARLTAWRSAQEFVFADIMRDLEELRRLEDWSGVFIVADGLDFDWRKAPLKRYESFKHFYKEELQATWGKWEDLQATYRKVVRGDLDEADANRWVTERARKAQDLAGPDGVAPAAAHGTNQHQREGGHDNVMSSPKAQGNSAAYLTARLKRDHPAIAARLASGEFPSVRAAARAAGIVKDCPPAPDAEAARILRWGDGYALAVVDAVMAGIRKRAAGDPEANAEAIVERGPEYARAVLKALQKRVGPEQAGDDDDDEEPWALRLRLNGETPGERIKMWEAFVGDTYKAYEKEMEAGSAAPGDVVNRVKLKRIVGTFLYGVSEERKPDGSPGELVDVANDYFFDPMLADYVRGMLVWHEHPSVSVAEVFLRDIPIEAKAVSAELWEEPTLSAAFVGASAGE